MADGIWRYWRYFRARARTGGSGGLTGEAPRPPRELVYAWRVSIADLRPWEYDGMNWWQYETILHAQTAWQQAQRDLPADDVPVGRPAAPEIEPSGVGPQLAP